MRAIVLILAVRDYGSAPVLRRSRAARVNSQPAQSQSCAGYSGCAFDGAAAAPKPAFQRRSLPIRGPGDGYLLPADLRTSRTGEACSAADASSGDRSSRKHARMPLRRPAHRRNQINPTDDLYKISVTTNFVQIPVMVKDRQRRRVDGCCRRISRSWRMASRRS